MARRLSPQERYWSHVDQSAPGGCWPWRIGCTRDGYGRFKVAGRDEVAHRWAYCQFIGEIPEGRYVLHHCDNPPCQNPDHWFVGTKQENSDDCIRKGRHAALSGEQAPSAKLTWQQVDQIRAEYPAARQVDLAQMYNVSQRAISSIVRRETWNSPVGVSGGGALLNG